MFSKSRFCCSLQLKLILESSKRLKWDFTNFQALIIHLEPVGGKSRGSSWWFAKHGPQFSLSCDWNLKNILGTAIYIALYKMRIDWHKSNYKGLKFVMNLKPLIIHVTCECNIKVCHNVLPIQIRLCLWLSKEPTDFVSIAKDSPM